MLQYWGKLLEMFAYWKMKWIWDINDINILSLNRKDAVTLLLLTEVQTKPQRELEMR